MNKFKITKKRGRGRNKESKKDNINPEYVVAIGATLYAVKTKGNQKINLYFLNIIIICSFEQGSCITYIIFNSFN